MGTVTLRGVGCQSCFRKPSSLYPKGGKPDYIHYLYIYIDYPPAQKKHRKKYDQPERRKGSYHGEPMERKLA